MAAAAIVEFDVSKSRDRPVSTSTPNSVSGDDISNGVLVMAIYVFLRWRPAAILDFGGSEIWRYYCFRNVGFSFWAKFFVYNCNCDRVMAVKVNFQNGGRRHLGLFGSEMWRHPKSRAARIYIHTRLGEDIWRSAELWRFMCFQNGGRPPSSILAEFKSGGISVSGASVLVSEPNVVRICAIATELWPFKWIFKMAAAAILNLLPVPIFFI